VLTYLVESCLPVDTSLRFRYGLWPVGGVVMFEEELKFFISNQDDLVKKYRGKVLVLKGKTVLGAYSSPLEAYIEAQKEHKIGTFMIQPCEPGVDAYTVSIASACLINT
jgi:hypothetical protein